MGRPKGAKNKGPSKAELKAKANEIQSPETDNPADSKGNSTQTASKPGKSGAKKTGNTSAVFKAPKVEADTYECGACGATLPAQVNKCPTCGTGLAW